MHDSDSEFEWVTVTKLQAAQIQLRTAIQLWFEGVHAVGIHTLVCAAHEIINALFTRAGHKDLLFDTPTLSEDRRREFVRMVRADANFFKHADRKDEQADTPRVFCPEINFELILVCLRGLERMNAEHGPVELAFVFWTRVHRPEVYFEDSGVQDSIPVDQIKRWRRLGKREFVRRYVALWSKRHDKDAR